MPVNRALLQKIAWPVLCIHIISWINLQVCYIPTDEDGNNNCIGYTDVVSLAEVYLVIATTVKNDITK